MVEDPLQLDVACDAMKKEIDKVLEGWKKVDGKWQYRHEGYSDLLEEYKLEPNNKSQ